MTLDDAVQALETAKNDPSLFARITAFQQVLNAYAGAQPSAGQEPALPEPEIVTLLVEVDARAAAGLENDLMSVTSIRSVSVHNDEYPNGCCCQHCPHRGNCRD